MHAVVLSSARWSALPLTKQAMAVALAELGHSVLYLEPPISPLSPLRHPDRLRELWSAADGSPAPGVRTWRPTVLPGQNSRVGQRLNARRQLAGVRRRAPRPDLAVSYALEARSLFRRLSCRRVYHCTDSVADLPGAGAAQRRWEDELVGAADLVVASSRPLVAALAERGHPAHYLPPGYAAPVGVPDAGRRDGRPVLGYVGSLNFRLDAALLDAALAAVPDARLVLVGGRPAEAGPDVDAALRRVLARPQVQVTGPRSRAEAAALMAGWDVGLVPYAATPFNRRSFPLKVLDYLAAGLPVVSTPNGATDEYADAVGVAGDPAGFAAAVREAVSQPPTERVAAARARVAARPWTKVASELLDLCGRP